MVFITNPFLLPFLIVIWSAEAWLFLASAKLILTKIPSMANNRILASLNQFADPPVNFMQRTVSRLANKQIPSWSSWLITFVTIIMLRNLLIAFLMSAQTK